MQIQNFNTTFNDAIINNQTELVFQKKLKFYIEQQQNIPEH